MKKVLLITLGAVGGIILYTHPGFRKGVESGVNYFKTLFKK